MYQSTYLIIKNVWYGKGIIKSFVFRIHYSNYIQSSIQTFVLVNKAGYKAFYANCKT